jgi:hypothetical protein
MSCLCTDDPHPHHLLNVLELAHKYDAPIVTACARTLATKLFSPETIQEHLSSSISPNRIVEVGMITSSQELADSGWAKVIEELRKQKRESHEVIKLAE